MKISFAFLFLLCFLVFSFPSHGNDFFHDMWQQNNTKTYYPNGIYQYEISLKGWHLNYRDEGERGIKPFELTARIKNTIKEAKVSSEIDISFFPESDIWGKGNSFRHCRGTIHFQLNYPKNEIQNLLYASKQSCKEFNDLSVYLNRTLFFPIFFSTKETESDAAPTYMSELGGKQSYLDTLFQSQEGVARVQWEMRKKKDLIKRKKYRLEILLNGNLKSDLTQMNLFGSLAIDIPNLILSRLDYSYSRISPLLVYPKDLAKIQFYSLHITRKEN